MTRTIIVILALAACLWEPSRAHAGDQLWSAVVIARNLDKPTKPPKELKVVADRLERVFGYNSFEIIGTDTKPIEDGATRELKPTKTFWLSLSARQTSAKEARGGYLLNVELYQEKKPLVDTIAMIAPQSPLFFRGPMRGRGQVLIVLQLTK
ncbi:MAG: hypothetical protein ABI680_02330 [Chthoniobacteraceae bacterium]